MKNSLLILPFLVPAFASAQLESVTRLQDVVVSASLAEQDRVQAPASISVITKEDLAVKPYRDIAEALSQTEGVVLSGSNDRGISLRGFSSSYTLILVDGKRLSSRSLSVRHNADADLSWIPMTDIERIEIIRGPMATIYGSDAIGGVVNIITKKVSSSWKSSVAISSKVPEKSEDTDLTKGEVFLSGPVIKDHWGLKLNASSSTSNPPSFSADDARQYSGHKDYSYSSSLTWKLTPVQDVTFDIGKNFETEKSLYQGTVSETKVDRSSYALTHEYKGENLSTQLQAQVDDYDYKNTQGPAKLQTQTGKGTIKLSAGERHFLVGGVEAESNRLENKAQITSGSTSSSQWAAFLEDSVSLGTQTTLTVGARQTQHEKFGGNTSPRAYLVYNLSPEWTLKGGVGTGFKTPSLLQMEKDFSLSSCRGRCTVVGDPNLKPESSRSYEISANYGVEQWDMNVTVFRSELTDMITTYFDTVGSRRYRLYRNVGEARTQGVETGVGVWVNRFLKTSANLTFVDGRNITDDVVLTNNPDIAANFKVEWSATERLSLYGRINYLGQRKIETTTSTETAPPYALFNLSSSYKLPRSWLPQSRVSLGVDNVMDHTLDESYGYGEPGRMYFGKLTVEI